MFALQSIGRGALRTQRGCVRNIEHRRDNNSNCREVKLKFWCPPFRRLRLISYLGRRLLARSWVAPRIDDGLVWDVGSAGEPGIERVEVVELLGER